MENTQFITIDDFIRIFVLFNTDKLQQSPQQSSFISHQTQSTNTLEATVASQTTPLTQPSEPPFLSQQKDESLHADPLVMREKKKKKKKKNQKKKEPTCEVKLI
jgi:hypothetical protein